jgi:hypothetical protein
MFKWNKSTDEFRTQYGHKLAKFNILAIVGDSIAMACKDGGHTHNYAFAKIELGKALECQTCGLSLIGANYLRHGLEVVFKQSFTLVGRSEGADACFMAANGTIAAKFYTIGNREARDRPEFTILRRGSVVMVMVCQKVRVQEHEYFYKLRYLRNSGKIAAATREGLEFKHLIGRYVRSSHGPERDALPIECLTPVFNSLIRED